MVGTTFRIYFVVLHLVNVACEHCDDPAISNVTRKLEEIRQSNSDKAQFLQTQLEQLKSNQDWLQDSTNKLRALFEDVRKSDASNKMLLRDLSDKFNHLKDTRNFGLLVHEAARSGNTFRLRLLLNGDAPMNYTDANGNRPIHVAIKNSHPEVVNILLNYQDDIGYPGENDYTPLHWASHNNCYECANILLERGASVYSRDDRKETPLIKAAKYGYTDLVKLLLEYAAEINAKQEKDLTALHMASREGKLDTVRLLVAHNANLTAKNSDGQAPLDLAFIHEHDEVVSFLRNLLKRSSLSLRND